MTRTIVIDTIDRGPVEIEEPDWCKGHDGLLVGRLSEVSHDGPEITAAVDIESVGLVRLLSVSLTHAPFLETRPEPHPVAYIEGVEAASVDADGLRQIVAACRPFLDRLEALARQLDELAAGGSS